MKSADEVYDSWGVLKGWYGIKDDGTVIAYSNDKDELEEFSTLHEAKLWIKD